MSARQKYDEKRRPAKPGGGIYHALIGTLEQVGLATLIAVPLGILTAVYLVEYGRGSRLGSWVSFFVDVMTGVPSIVAGLFIYTLWVLTFGFERSGFAASLALTILMLPVVIRASEEMLRIVEEQASLLGIKVRLGRDFSFRDYPHVELAE